jgi:hypothetical protein
MLCEKNILLNLATFRKSCAKCFAKKIFCSTLQLLEKVAQSFWLHLSQRWKKVEKGGN